MSVNVNVKKIVIVVGALLIVSSCIYWFTKTRDVRVRNSEYKQLVKFANRQAVEIAIIEQRSKLLDYQQQIAAAQQKKVSQSIRPNPPMPAVVSPTVDPEKE